MACTIPEYLKKGDTIGIVCPAGYMPFHKITACINMLEHWGFQVKKGTTLSHQFHYFSGTDEERLHDLQNMLNNPTIKAILCARGGYGISRIIDSLNFSTFIQHPKWIIGFSDVTVLLTHLYTQFHIAGLHAPMAAAFDNVKEENNIYLQAWYNAITGNCTQYTCPAHTMNKQGEATGELIGGNLSLITHLIGTSSDLNTTNKILFIEDVGEYIYHIDRMMMQLKRSGKLSQLSGLIVGKFTDLKDTTIPFGQTVYELIFDKIKEYHYPVCFDFPVGHVPENYALKTGMLHSLSVKAEVVKLQEIR